MVVRLSHSSVKLKKSTPLISRFLTNLSAMAFASSEILKTEPCSRVSRLSSSSFFSCSTSLALVTDLILPVFSDYSFSASLTPVFTLLLDSPCLTNRYTSLVFLEDNFPNSMLIVAITFNFNCYYHDHARLSNSKLRFLRYGLFRSSFCFVPVFFLRQSESYCVIM